MPLGVAAGARRSPGTGAGTGRWGWCCWWPGDSLTRWQDSCLAGRAGHCPAPQGHSRVTRRGDGGFSQTVSLQDCHRPQPRGTSPPPAARAPHRGVRAGTGSMTITVVGPAGGGQGETPSRHLPKITAHRLSTPGPDPALLGAVGPCSASPCAVLSTRPCWGPDTPHPR